MVANQVTNFMPFRNNLFSLIYEHDDMSKKQNILITGIFYVIIIIISIVFPDVVSVLGIFGGLTSTTICYIIPGKNCDYCKLYSLVYCYVKLRNMGDEMSSFKNILSIIFFTVLVFFGLMAIIMNFIKIADPESSLFVCH